MELVLLSGGSGKRLWPLSNDARSKQFLKILKNSNGEQCSMVQRVWRQITNVSLSNSTIIATSKSQVDMIQNQLGADVPLIIEPERRDTFPAIALAATYLYSIKGVSLDEVVSVLPVDPYVEDDFFQKIKELENVIKLTKSDLALIGVKPSYPSEKYGYIVPEKELQGNEYLKVSHFKEKPSQELAKKLINDNALWNSGVFAFKLEYIINILMEQELPIQYDELLNQYNRLTKNSFDYEVVEKAEQIVSIPYEGSWKDLGTWNTLTEEMVSQKIGKGIISSDCKNTHLINELDIPVAILGMSNALIAVSPDGILVTDKEASPKVKELVSSFEQRPMYEERRWGWYQVLDYTKFPNEKEVLTKKIGIAAGKNLSYQLHHKRSEVWTIISGEGEYVLDDQIEIIKAGDVLNIPVGSKHGIKATTDLQFIEVQTGTDIVEEDIVRIYMTWKEVEQNCHTNIK
ncbi:sugar phosphate nucleotidyltransferase [Salisediminibacterium beveridgei]|uniref:Mannose-1-phosphate guanylyltransferase (GDP) n=1 Tax=Salisediminibacterium beveridgei TaxID=632773 RepID=A0A1D7QRM5_9BACI|nr:sugar phosphate nucleotidyltransferase [Salisediminibacterium beveridgei]AOM81656.1 Mannose-1-phosphate guanylyltransferase (GDP) [Salisediminibacterium beveridgei]